MHINEITYQEKAGLPGYSSVLISLTAIIAEEDEFSQCFDQLKQIVRDKITERIQEQEAMHDPEGPATKRQMNYLKQLAKRRNTTLEALEQEYGSFDTVSRASEIIDALLASSA